MTKLEHGFTLAETLITLTILGVVAAIIVPSLINKQIESANRTKVKKAMAVYEKALNQMIIDNDAKGSIKDVEGFATTDGCSGSRPYFKSVEDGNNNCQFKTADRVWWDITDIEKPIISFKKDDLTADNAGDSATKKAFYLIGRRDTNGILRIDDKGYEDSITSGNADNQKYMAKLYNFINNVEDSSGGDTSIFASCSEFPCEVNGLNWKNKIQISQAEADAAKTTKDYFCIWDPENKSCDNYDVYSSKNTSTAEVGDLVISDKLTLTTADAKSAENCATSRDQSSCTTYGDYWNLARRKCEEAGGRLPTTAELKVMKSKGQLYGSSWYWAAEANSNYSENAYFLYTDEDEGVYSDLVFYYYNKAVCVGN